MSVAVRALKLVNRGVRAMTARLRCRQLEARLVVLHPDPAAAAHLIECCKLASFGHTVGRQRMLAYLIVCLERGERPAPPSA